MWLIHSSPATLTELLPFGNRALSSTGSLSSLALALLRIKVRNLDEPRLSLDFGGIPFSGRAQKAHGCAWALGVKFRGYGLYASRHQAIFTTPVTRLDI